MSKASAFILTMMFIFTILYVDGCITKLDRNLDIQNHEYSSEINHEITIKCNGMFVKCEGE